MSPIFALLPHIPIHATRNRRLIKVHTGSLLPGKKDLQDTLALGDTHSASGEVKTLGLSNGDTYFLGPSPCPTRGGPWAQTPSGPVRGPNREQVSAE